MSRASNEDVKSRAKAGVIVVQGRALQAKEQFTPLARSAQLTASQGLYQARVWAAPRVERAGIVVQESIAPAVSSAMTAAARRVQPVEVKQRRLWPAILAGIVTATAGAVAAVLLSGKRASRLSDEPAPEAPPIPPANEPASSNEQPDPTQVDVNGQVRTP